MKSTIVALLLVITCFSCNNSEVGSTEINDQDSGAKDTMGDTRGMRGTGTDNTGGTPGPGTITDTFKGQSDTADHTSRRDSLK